MSRKNLAPAFAVPELETLSLEAQRPGLTGLSCARTCVTRIEQTAAAQAGILFVGAMLSGP